MISRINFLLEFHFQNLHSPSWACWHDIRGSQQANPLISNFIFSFLGIILPPVVYTFYWRYLTNSTEGENYKLSMCPKFDTVIKNILNFARNHKTIWLDEFGSSPLKLFKAFFVHHTTSLSNLETKGNEHIILEYIPKTIHTKAKVIFKSMHVNRSGKLFNLPLSCATLPKKQIRNHCRDFATKSIISASKMVGCVWCACSCCNRSTWHS